MGRPEYIGATPDLCFGRELLLSDIRTKSFERGCILLFGGRQAGKTTAMLRLARDMGQDGADTTSLSCLDLPVYVDLTCLPVEATPSDFFRLLAEKAMAACELHLIGFEQRELPSISNMNHANDHLGVFIKDVLSILAGAGEAYVRFLFLLDEAKRVLGSRFPRGFQDNLFSLLYGEHGDVSGRVAIVFSGAQDLLGFCEDETSPIGSRAGQCFVPCLDLGAVTDIVNALNRGHSSQVSGGGIAQSIFQETGGHAGLTVRLTRNYFALNEPNPKVIPELADSLIEEESMLFRIWTESLSKEARAIHPLLFETEKLSRNNISATLRDCGMSPFRSTTVIKEFVFTGIAIEDDAALRPVNKIYWEFVGSIGAFSVRHAIDPSSSLHVDALKRKCWDAIEELELKLRDYVLTIYRAKWCNSAISMMKTSLGEDNWQIINSNLRKTEAQYPLSREIRSLREVDGMYIGQLIQLILWRKAWPLFNSYLPKKSEIQRWCNEVMPVRNDRAHFREVPEKELRRCWLACDDFIVALDKATNVDSLSDRN